MPVLLAFPTYGYGVCMLHVACCMVGKGRRSGAFGKKGGEG